MASRFSVVIVMIAITTVTSNRLPSNRRAGHFLERSQTSTAIVDEVVAWNDQYLQYLHSNDAGAVSDILAMHTNDYTMKKLGLAPEYGHEALRAETESFVHGDIVDRVEIEVISADESPDHLDVFAMENVLAYQGDTFLGNLKLLKVFRRLNGETDGEIRGYIDMYL